MRYDSETIRWGEQEIEFVRAHFSARVPRPQIIALLRDQFGINSTPRALDGLITRHCAEERKVRAQQVKEKLAANQARARELIASGSTPLEAAKIMGVSNRCIYDWVPQRERASLGVWIGPSLKCWLDRFAPVPVPPDPIIAHGKLITDLESDNCRWPIGKDVDGLFRFCGCHFHRIANRHQERPYCDHHAKDDVRPVKTNPLGRLPKYRDAAKGRALLRSDAIELQLGIVDFDRREAA